MLEPKLQRLIFIENTNFPFFTAAFSPQLLEGRGRKPAALTLDTHLTYTDGSTFIRNKKGGKNKGVRDVFTSLYIMK